MRFVVLPGNEIGPEILKPTVGSAALCCELSHYASSRPARFREDSPTFGRVR
jgi:hypothetical protein